MNLQKHKDALYPYKLFFHDCIWEDNKIIYPASNCNAICETDISTGETIVIGRADEEKEQLLFFGIYKWKEYLILPSWNARTVLNVFNLISKEWSYIAIEENRKNWLNFREENVFEYNGYLYSFPFSLVVLKIDIEKKEVSYLFYPDMQPNSDMRGEISCIEKMIYIPIRHSNKIYKFDLSTEQWEVIEVNTELRGIDTLCFDGKLFWMTGIGQMICSWNKENNTSVSYKKFPHRFKKLVARKGEEGFWFCRSIVYGNSIYFVPSDANMVIEFDTKRGEANELFIADEWEEEEDMRVGRFSTIKYMGAKKKDNILMMLSNKNKNLILIDLNTKKTFKTELKLSVIDKMISDISVTNEGLVSLNVWLKYIGGYQQGYNMKQTGYEETAGGRIYSLY